MASGIPARPQLLVEGEDDVEVIRRLLCIRKALSFDPKWTRSEQAYRTEVAIESMRGAQQLLAAIPSLVSESVARPIGFVLDANGDRARRWTEIRDLLADFEFPATLELAASGFVSHSAHINARIGVWLMPDNSAPGAIEEFLYAMVPDIAPDLFGHAKRSANDAKSIHDAPFRPADLKKAELRTWLAWQNPPGRLYGPAVTGGLLDLQSELATRFVSWFRRLYDGYLPPVS